MSAVVDYRFDGGAAWITLVAAEHGNPVSRPMAEQLLAAVQQARQDDAAVIAITAVGRAFSVGGDVRAMGASSDRRRFVEDLAELFHRSVSDLHHADAVVVASVQGVAAGAGFSLAAAADLVLAAESARFTLAYTRIGLSPDGGSSLLVNSLGLHRALSLALLNPLLSAHELRERGLVTSVHPDDELAAATEQLVAGLLAGSRSAQVAAKRLLRQASQPLAEGQLRRESLSIGRLAASPDGAEGVESFLAKRPARFASDRVHAPDAGRRPPPRQTQPP